MATARSQSWSQRFHDLMPHQVHYVLLVSSDYDAFVIEEDGRLTERLFADLSELDMPASPRIVHVSTAAEALGQLEGRRFDLVLTTMRLEDPGVLRLSVRVKARFPRLPVVLLVLDEHELRRLYSAPLPTVDEVFLWTGDSRILLAIVKLIEDRLNVEADTRAGVQVIIVVEDSVRRYSTFLAMLYQELIGQSQTLVAEGVNALHKMLRVRARPKILLARNYEEARETYQDHRQHTLALITDLQFPRDGKMDDEAGFKLAREIQVDNPSLPIFLQSANPDVQSKAWELGAHYADKNSPTLLKEIRSFVKETLGFGDFVFRLPDRTELGRASNMYELERVLRTVDQQALLYHASNDHFNVWLRARSMFDLADYIKTIRAHDFHDIEDLRNLLVELIRLAGQEEQRGVVADFISQEDGYSRSFVKLGQGSLGGKGRGLAFLNSLLARQGLADEFSELFIQIPRTIVVATGEFDRYLESCGLDARVHSPAEFRSELERRELPPELLGQLRVALRTLTGPLAARSSSLLEDSQHQSCAGIYETVLLPNNEPDLEGRLAALSRGIRRVYASMFSERAESYLRNTSFSLEQEKMAIVIQELVGDRHGNLFYPHFSGVALSYNYYPIGPQEPEDGIALLALGLGHTVAEGGRSVRFCPRYPQVLPHLAAPRDFLSYAQTEFYALDLVARDGEALRLFDLDQAEEDGTLQLVGSVYSPDDDQLRENFRQAGPRVVTFNNILKWRSLPLAPVLERLLDVLRRGIGSPVEMEFAVSLSSPATLSLLQVRPLSEFALEAPIDLDGLPADRVVGRSPRSMGHGCIEVRHVLYVKSQTPGDLKAIAREIGAFNKALSAEGYLLIGPGRWGSSDPSLGIPVDTGQITGARVIVELAFLDRMVEPSVGSHFFHELTSLRIGYLYVPPDAFLDWEWLRAQPVRSESESVAHVALSEPLQVWLDGRRRQAAIVRVVAPD